MCEQTRTCENCGFSEEVSQTSMNDIPDPKVVKCTKKGHCYSATDFCDEWEPKDEQKQ